MDLSEHITEFDGKVTYYPSDATSLIDTARTEGAFIAPVTLQVTYENTCGEISVKSIVLDHQDLEVETFTKHPYWEKVFSEQVIEDSEWEYTDDIEEGEDVDEEDEDDIRVTRVVKLDIEATACVHSALLQHIEDSESCRVVMYDCIDDENEISELKSKKHAPRHRKGYLSVTFEQDARGGSHVRSMSLDGQCADTLHALLPESITAIPYKQTIDWSTEKCFECTRVVMVFWIPPETLSEKILQYKGTVTLYSPLVISMDRIRTLCEDHKHMWGCAELTYARDGDTGRATLQTVAVNGLTTPELIDYFSWSGRLWLNHTQQWHWVTNEVHTPICVIFKPNKKRSAPTA